MSILDRVALVACVVVPLVFVLFEMEELSMAEVAGIVGCPVQTAYSRLHVARREVERIAPPDRLRMGSRTPADTE